MAMVQSFILERESVSEKFISFLPHQLEGKDILAQEKYEKFLCSFLWKSIYPEQPVLTETTEIKIDYGILSAIRPYYKIEKDPKELEQSALIDILASFSKIEKVKSIYFQRYRDEIQVYVLISVEHYDSKLMDTLLDAEYEIRKKYIQLIFEFFYPPAGLSEKEDFIHPKAQCIFAR